ncbi:hypothetical protein VTH8203_00834 [Vibrio thalassae]|uniref:Pilin accessory protein (PilO) n=1 Tax=Vibrio thalassae TaxID=1243014 RepID=A0A240EG33_9VIBR|nr:hypothetical protein [Vibrio thalassae]SNX47233.1 hypothetical protein VTH8203_00834 [Vibrio thalassae]
MLNIKVQVVKLVKGGEKESLSRMRQALPSRYDYVITTEENLIRYSGNETGVVVAQLYADQIKKEYSESLIDGNYYQLLSEHIGTFTLITVKNWIVSRIEVVLEEQIEDMSLMTWPIFSTVKSIDIHRPQNEILALEPLCDDVLSTTLHQLTDQREAQRKKQIVIACVVATFACLLTIFWPEPKVAEKAPPPPPKVLTVELDRHHQYKKSVENGIEYHNIHQSLLAMALTAFKLPNGWKIETITLANNQLIGRIDNFNGQTQQLKEFRKQDANGDFIQIDGQSANYSFPIINDDWFRWTQQTADFSSERDAFMDEMILLGGKIKSNATETYAQYSQQTINVTMEDVSVAYLDLFASSMYDRPIFIQEFTVRPMADSLGLISIDMTVKIVGR